MADHTLVTALRRYEYNDVLFDEQAHDGVTFRIATYEGALLTAMRAMLRERAYDVCEMSPTSYLIARQAGAPLIALPVFPFRQYALGQIVARADSAVRDVRDLPGKRIAVRTWAQPTALWVRYYLSDYLGVDLSGVTWVFVADDPVPGLKRPEGAIERRGQTLDGLLASGEADVAIGLRHVPEGCRTLIADPQESASAWTRATGIVPANHLVVMDAKYAGTEVPDLVCQRFETVLRDYLAAHGTPASGVIADLERINPELDPLPNGRRANARMWEALVSAMVAQGMLEPVAEPLALLHDWEPARA
ncbi:4,5-dihydroxyphthalate decarboxylase [Pigmentiphaga humi]|uniref:4,5-dihydroxyphthalate decarboxylase n=1 Tax=Pigmentiphaga humi TaxID=2478468 RepID=A0A3P4B4E5_9BURK|nr:PhnD/SsuA/transferrin family substrate-binding protein [Pigmentiphaga humi]VCU70922.1 4,5-dihydroxyphthalate decarboxylase [Pigmentiphaga humi]